MEEVTAADFDAFVKKKGKVRIEPPFGQEEPVFIEVGQPHRPTRLAPEKFDLEASTVWSFEKRGDWATHKSNYRGNWAPQIVRNLLLRYTQPEDVVLDQMVGSGTTLIECKLLGRNGIGVDVNENAIMLTRDRLNFPFSTLDETIPKARQRTFLGDARNLGALTDNSVDFIATHPPYANIIPYSREVTSDDLSLVHDIDEFAAAMRKVADESYRVLKPGKFAAILMGDTRRKQMYIPVAYRTMQEFLAAGFVLKEDIIKRQWNCQGTPFWRRQSMKFNFHLIMHEHLFVFRKPDPGSKK